MATSMWYLVAPLLLVLVAGQIDDNDSQSFYERAESSSPAPLSSPTSNQRTEEKEVVLYLTLEQAETLKAAGAIVQPLPETQQGFSQQQYQQSNQEQREPELQSITTDAAKQNREPENFFRFSNTQQRGRDSEEDEATENQSEEQEQEQEQEQERTFPNYKYSSKSRQQEYSPQYTLKKVNRGKTYPSENVRYLPNQEAGNLKMERFRAQPIPGYRFENLKPKNQPQTYQQTETPERREPLEIKTTEELRQVIAELSRSLKITPERPQQLADEAEQTVSINKDKGPVTFQGKALQPAKVWEPAPVRETNIWKSDRQAEEKLQYAVRNPITVQRQMSSLLAPLALHEKIAASITEQKEGLINRELEIKNKLQQLRDSDNHDEEQYAAEIEKLNKNLGEQNALAQKLALVAAAKKYQPQTESKSEATFKKRRPTKVQKQEGNSKPIRVLVQIPKPSEWRWPESNEGFRPIPVPVLQAETRQENPFEAKVQRPVPNPVTRDFYIKAERGYTLQKPTEYKPEIPSSLAIIRHIWDH